MQQMRFSKGITVGLAMLAAATLGACKGRDQYAANDSAKAANDSAAGKIDTAHRTDTVAGATTPGNTAWTPVAALSYIMVADNGEIREGTLVQKKATSPAVKAFGRQLVTDHKAGLTDAKTLAQKMNITLDTTSDNAKDLIGHTNDELKDLNQAKAGADWDKDFLDKTIDDHQHVLDKLQDASKNTTDPEVRALLEKATGKVQEHLTKAQDLKAKAK